MADKLRATQTFSRDGAMVARGAVLTVGKDIPEAEAQLYIREGKLVPAESKGPASATVKRDAG